MVRIPFIFNSPEDRLNKLTTVYLIANSTFAGAAAITASVGTVGDCLAIKFFTMAATWSLELGVFDL
jgi:hypothetical protein